MASRAAKNPARRVLAAALALGFVLIFAAAFARERALDRARSACAVGALWGCQRACRALDSEACHKAEQLERANSSPGALRE